MKERFKQIRKVVDGVMVFYYIKQQKKHWWSKWKAIMKDGAPLLSYKLPEGVRAVNELPHFKLGFSLGVRQSTGSQMSCPVPPYPKGDTEVRDSMINMVRNADEIYVGIKQDGKYYMAYDTDSRQSLLDLQSLKLVEDEE